MKLKKYSIKGFFYFMLKKELKKLKKDVDPVINDFLEKNHDDFSKDAYKIHTNFRKIRALLRLVRDKRDNYSKENKFLRELKTVIVMLLQEREFCWNFPLEKKLWEK